MTKEEIAQEFILKLEALNQFTDTEELARHTRTLMRKQMNSLTGEDANWIKGKVINSKEFVAIIDRISYIVRNNNGEADRVFGKHGELCPEDV